MRWNIYFWKPGYHGTGSARGERASSTASEARAGRAAEKRKNRSKGIESSRTAREARASLVASRRAWTIAGGLSHARSARALGRLRWEPLVHVLSVSLGACVKKRVPQCRLPSGRPPGSHLGAILGAILEPFWDPRRAPGAPGEPQESKKRPKMRPRRPKMTPRRAQEARNEPQESPGGPK